MKITEIEMQGLISGECLPGDMRLNESLPAYLVRKFTELQKQCDAMLAENVGLKKNIHMHAAGFSACSACGHEESGENDDIVWMSRNTPDTDSILNTVRAEGVEMFSIQQREQIGKPHKSDAALSYAAREAVKFASQLRADAAKDGE